MPRNSTGVYTLPSGINPVTPQTIIATSWANPTLQDIASELTNSLDRNGRGGMLASFKVTDGTLSLPGLAFTNEPGAGLWRSTTSTVHMALAGANIQTWTPAGTNIAGALTINGNPVVTGGPYLPLTGGTLSGNLAVPQLYVTPTSDLNGVNIGGSQINTGISINSTAPGVAGNWQIMSTGTGSGYGAGRLVFALGSVGVKVAISSAGDVAAGGYASFNATLADPRTVVLNGFRNFQAQTYGAVSILAMSNGTPGSHDFGAIRFEQNPANGDGSGAVTRFYCGGASSLYQAPYEYLTATTQTATGIQSVHLRVKNQQRFRLTEAGCEIYSPGAAGYEQGLALYNNFGNLSFTNIAFFGTAGQNAGIESYQEDASNSSLQFKTRVAGVYAERVRITKEGWLSVNNGVAGVFAVRGTAVSGAAFCQLLVDYQGNSGSIYIDAAATYLRDNNQANVQLINAAGTYFEKPFYWNKRVAQGNTSQINSGTWDWSQTTTQIQSTLAGAITISAAVKGEIKRCQVQSAVNPATLFALSGGTVQWIGGNPTTIGPGMVSFVCVEPTLIWAAWSKL